MEFTIGKLVTVYNKLYKNALNLNAKMENLALLSMQGKNQFLNIVEHQSISTTMRLLMSNQYFHEGKVGTEEPDA